MERHSILIQTKTDTFKAFTWIGRASDGIARAEKEAKQFGVEWINIFAVKAAAQ